MGYAGGGPLVFPAPMSFLSYTMTAPSGAGIISPKFVSMIALVLL